MKKTEHEVKNAGIGAIEALFAVGAHFGFIRSRRHPSMEPFMFGTKNKIEIFDLEKTQTALAQAVEFVETVASKGGTILFVGGKNEAREAVTSGATSVAQPYVAGRFIGGTLTNFPEIRKRVEKLELLVSQKEKGELAKYTKKERLLIDREIDTLHELFFGISVMKRLPQAVFVVDSKRESIAVKEAHTLGIPVIALCGSDNNLGDVEYPIPGNDSSKASIDYFVKELTRAFKNGEMKKHEVVA